MKKVSTVGAKPSRHFAFAGLLRCARDGCTITTELQKGRYIYYRCSHGRGKCSLPYMREEELSDRLGGLLAGIHVPDAVARKIVDCLHSDVQQSEKRPGDQQKALAQRLATVRSRMDRIYDDKLDGKINEELWTRKQSELREQELAVETELSRLNVPVKQKNVLTIERVFELANKAHRSRPPSLIRTQHGSRWSS